MDSSRNIFWRTFIHILSFLCILRSCSADNSEKCHNLWKDTLEKIKGTQAEFESAVTPFALAAKTSYTFPSRKDEIPGWTFINGTSNAVGLHAVVYQNNRDAEMLLVGIRGVNMQQPGSAEALADLCALWYLVDSTDPEYNFCKSFTSQQIDYVQQLDDYISTTVRQLPTVQNVSMCIATTGHSMGALAASLYSARYNDSLPAVVFASSPQKKGLSKLGYSGSMRQVIQIYIELDLIVHLSCDYQIGEICKFEQDPKNENCSKCVQDPKFSLVNPALGSVYCNQCFQETHFYSQLLKTIFRAKLKPKCYGYHGPMSGGKHPACRDDGENRGERGSKKRPPVRFG